MGVKFKEYKSLNLLVYEKLREYINHGTLPPGSRLVVDRISEEFGVSKIPVREAVQKLAAEGLVKIIPNKGAEVTVYSPWEVEEIYDVRSYLEPVATRLATEKMTDADLRVLEEIFTRMDRATKEKDYKKIPEINWDFHEHLFKCAGNSWLYKVLIDLWSRTRRSNATFTYIERYAERMFAEHEKLMKAFRNRDVDAAEATAKTHLLSAKQAAKEYAEKWGGAAQIK